MTNIGLDFTNRIFSFVQKLINMKKLYFILLVGIASFTASAQCNEIFISEYIEGTSSNKAFEIYNPTANPINLSNYVCMRFNNGATSPSDSVQLGGMIPAYGSYVIANPSADAVILAQADTTSTLTYYNGDDALVLVNVTTTSIVDVIGVVGVDPGSSWAAGSGATAEYTLVRKANVQMGTTNWDTLGTEWDVYPQNTFSYIGSHTSDCFVPAIPISNIGDIRVNDANGEALYDDSLVSVIGTVHSIDYDGNNGISFYMADATGAINIFNFNDVSNYVVREGDRIRVEGDVENYNGLTEVFADSIEVLDSFQVMAAPIVVTMPSEVNESYLVTVNKVWIADGTTMWPSGGNVLVTNGTDTSTVRIDNDAMGLAGMAVAFDTMDITGINGQFDGSSPRTEGYQILPRYAADIIQWVDPIKPFSNIGDIRTNAADGSPMYDDSLVRVQGIVHGIDYDGNNGLSFTLIDATGGINIFNFNDVSNYVVTEGDEIWVQGAIDFYNGLTEIFADTINVVSTGNSVNTATVVSAPSEMTESTIIQVRKVWLVDTNMYWPSSSTNMNFTNGTDTMVIRLDGDVSDVAGTMIQWDTMNISGIGGQFDGSSPYTEGYQIFPRYLADIEEWIQSVGINDVSNEVNIYPNPTSGMVRVDGLEVVSYVLIDLQGRTVISASSESNAIVLPNVTEGLYILELRGPSGLYAKRKINIVK